MVNLFSEVRQYIALLNEKNELLWVRSSNDKQKFMFPGGTMEEGESAEEALKREIQEETNLTVQVHLPFFVSLISYKKPAQFAVVYLGSHPKGDLKLSHEHTEFKWSKWQDMKEEDLPHPDFKKVAKQAVELYHKLNPK